MKSEHASGGRLGTLKPRVRSASVMDFRTRYITPAYGVDLSDYKDLHPGRVTIERGVLRQSISYVPPSLHNYDVGTISNKRLYLIIMVSAVDREIDIESVISVVSQTAECMIDGYKVSPEQQRRLLAACDSLSSQLRSSSKRIAQLDFQVSIFNITWRPSSVHTHHTLAVDRNDCYQNCSRHGNISDDSRRQQGWVHNRWNHFIYWGGPCANR